MKPLFLPTTSDEGKVYYKDNNKDKNFQQFDVIFVTGDPYYDHPLSGIAMLSRLLDAKGYKVGIIGQPLTDRDYQMCGKPKYFFCITSGLLDSMLANYTPMLKKRENVLVPERALMVYTQNLKNLFKGCITVIGGVEATIRRFTHFDYKYNILRRGVLNDTKADLLLFGSTERAILTLLDRMKTIVEFSDDKKLLEMTNRDDKLNAVKNTIKSSPNFLFEKIKPKLHLASIEGVAFRVKKTEIAKDIRIMPSYEECVADKNKFNLLTRVHYLLPDESFVEQ
ncbi:hypothetical protein HZA99_04875, partial [Candidatus Woesearchaeota archaeon]|nr:hypothetical protein [Candidatus Woesearchaeota archaeon]